MTLRLRFLDKATREPVTVQRLDVHDGHVRTVTVDGQEWSVSKFEAQAYLYSEWIESNLVFEDEL